MKEGRKPEYPEKTPGDELQKMPHTTARRFQPNKLALQWLPYRAPGVIRSVVGLVGPVSVYCDWVG